MPNLAIFIGDHVQHPQLGIGVVTQVKLYPDLRRDLWVKFEHTAIWVPSALVKLVKRSPANVRFQESVQ